MDNVEIESLNGRRMNIVLGFTLISIYPELLATVGISIGELVNGVVKVMLQR